MGWKGSVVIAGSVIALGAGVLTYLEPPANTSETRDQQVQQQVGDLSDQQENEHERLRRQGNELGQSTYRDSIGYGDVRPPEDLPRLRLRILP